MTELSGEDATLLAILAGNPHTARGRRIADRVDDPVARVAALVIIGEPPEHVNPQAQALAGAVREWADLNRDQHIRNHPIRT